MPDEDANSPPVTGAGGTGVGHRVLMDAILELESAAVSYGGAWHPGDRGICCRNMVEARHEETP